MTSKQTAEERAADCHLGIIRDSQEVFGKQAKTFDKMVEEYRSISETLKSLEEEKKLLQKRLQAFFIDSGLKTVMVDSLRVTLVQNQGRATIDKVMLAEHGVPATVISDCTRYGDPFEYIKITPAKE